MAGLLLLFPLSRTRQWRVALPLGAGKPPSDGGLDWGGRAEGLLAYEGDEVVGWCNAAPRELFPVLRRLPGNSEGTAFVPCFLIAPGRRRQGIARRLLQAACDAFERRGYRRLLGKPVRGVTSPADNAFGPLAIFIEAGFSVLFEDEKGNVYVERKLKPDAAPEKRPSQEAPEPP
ncbi:MAG: GNAT family N-acetyltransferase [Gammaproteobacteria bacterium]|nr:GNAT family N-acetyltransferase [Gammaproteobacteria bacterium]